MPVGLNRFLVLIAVVFTSATASVWAQERPRPKLPGFEGARGWLNVTEPLTVEDLKGKVVLIEFWTFC